MSKPHTEYSHYFSLELLGYMPRKWNTSTMLTINFCPMSINALNHVHQLEDQLMEFQRKRRKI
uniref:Uncharacterized protein n=1 Tax=Arundo donax TaxID=35708 RepID=A0A0A9A2R5_ARUDO